LQKSPQRSLPFRHSTQQFLPQAEMFATRSQSYLQLLKTLRHLKHSLQLLKHYYSNLSLTLPPRTPNSMLTKLILLRLFHWRPHWSRLVQLLPVRFPQQSSQNSLRRQTELHLPRYQRLTHSLKLMLRLTLLLLR